MNNREISNLCYQLSIVFKSGIPIADGIKLLASDFREQSSSHLLESVANMLDSGEGIADSFDTIDLLPDYMRDMVRVGEETGSLPLIFEGLTKYYRQKAELGKKILSAITYPAILFVMMIAVMGLLIFKLLPIFHNMFLSMGSEVPAGTMAIYNGAMALQSVFIYIVIVLIILAVFLVMVFKTKWFMRCRRFLLLRLPIINKIYKKSYLVKFTSALDLLVNSGYPLEISLEKAFTIIEDTAYSHKMGGLVHNGGLSINTMEELDIFPPLFFKMVNLGIKTGTLGEMITRFNGIYDEELDRLLQRSTDTIEPALVTIVSIIIGAILVVTLLPLIGIISAIGG